MRRLVVLLSVTGSLVANPLAAQDTTPTPKPPDSTHHDSVPPPTADQLKWMEGLRTAARGIGQLKSGIETVQRAGTSPTQLKRAGKLLAGFCGTGRGFMHTGVARNGVKPALARGGRGGFSGKHVLVRHNGSVVKVDAYVW